MLIKTTSCSFNDVYNFIMNTYYFYKLIFNKFSQYV